MLISEELDGRHIDVLASSEVEGKEQPNQLKVPLIKSNGSVLLEKSKSKSDGNIGEESKFGPSNEDQYAGVKSRSFAGSIDCEAHQGDAYSRRKKKLTEMSGFQLNELEKKRSNLHRKMPKKTNTVEGLRYSFKKIEAVRKQ